HAVLAAATGHLKGFGAGVKEEPLAAHRNGSGALLVCMADRPATGAGLDTDAAVERPAKRVEQGLAGNIAGETGKDDPPDVRLAVAVRVLGVQDVRRRADKDAAVVAADGRGRVHVVEEDGAFAVNAVALGVLQQADAAPAVGLLAVALIEFEE